VISEKDHKPVIKTITNNQAPMTKQNPRALNDTVYRNCSIPIDHCDLDIGYYYL